MKVTVSDAKGQLTDLVRRAEAGEEIILTRHGHEAVRLVPVAGRRKTPEERQKVLDEVLASAKAARLEREARGELGVSAERSQDFLYDENGLPG
jgi:prevent-host-death family protein